MSKISNWLASKIASKPKMLMPKFTIPKPSNGNEDVVLMATDANGDNAKAFDSESLEVNNCGGIPLSYSNIASMGFMGFPQMAILSRNAFVKNAINTISDEIVKNGIEIYSESADLKPQIKMITDAMEDFALIHTVQKALRKMLTFGGSFIYPKLAGDETELELHLPVNSSKLSKGCLRYFKVLEPTFVAPITFNASDPLKENFYRPDKWQIMGNTVDQSRLIHFVYNDVDELLLPAYRFQGQSLIELGLQYLVSFYNKQDNIDGIIRRLNQLVLKTKMGAIINYDANDSQLESLQMFDVRLGIVNEYIGNMNIVAIDKNTEDFVNVSMNLNNLDKLFNQSLELLGGVWKIPVTKLLGSAPQGMNATGEHEETNFRDMIRSMQRRYTPQVAYMLDIIQLHLFGEVNPDIGFKWNPLESESQLEKSQIRLNEAQANSTYKNDGVLTTEEIRGNLATNENSGYMDIPSENPDLDMADEADVYRDEG